ncbi:unnamed protein product [Ectocarpus sp. 12 AP-2014]
MARRMHIDFSKKHDGGDRMTTTQKRTMTGKNKGGKTRGRTRQGTNGKGYCCATRGSTRHVTAECQIRDSRIRLLRTDPTCQMESCVHVCAALKLRKACICNRRDLTCLHVASTALSLW